MSQLLPISQVSIDLNTDCVIVGAGACGVIAALALADAGIEALVLERDTKPTGSTSMSSGFIPAAGTRLQQALGIKDSAELFANDIQRKANNESDSALVKAVTMAIAPTLDWLESKHGLSWVLLQDFLYPGHSVCRMHTVAGKSGAALLEQLLGAAQVAGVSIACSARVDALLTDQRNNEQPSVCGVRIERTDGSFEHVKSPAVILACNGYGANKKLMRRFIPEMADAYYHGHAGNTGDAMLWGEQLGVPLLQTGAYQGHGSLAAGHNILITWALMMEGGVQVNSLGQRFSNEHGGYSEQAVNVMKQPNAIAWNIYDERLHALGMTFPDYSDAHACGAILRADDVSTIAAETGLPALALAHTLSHMDALAANNQPDEFGRTFAAKQKLQKPYYAVKVAPAVFHTQGGLSIDSAARVLDGNARVLTGLYAAGGAACGVSGSSVHGYLSGNGLLTAAALGKIAAETVVANREG